MVEMQRKWMFGPAFEHPDALGPRVCVGVWVCVPAPPPRPSDSSPSQHAALRVLCKVSTSPLLLPCGSAACACVGACASADSPSQQPCSTACQRVRTCVGGRHSWLFYSFLEPASRRPLRVRHHLRTPTLTHPCLLHTHPASSIDHDNRSLAALLSRAVTHYHPPIHHTHTRALLPLPPGPSARRCRVTQPRRAACSPPRCSPPRAPRLLPSRQPPPPRLRRRRRSPELPLPPPRWSWMAARRC